MQLEIPAPLIPCSSKRGFSLQKLVFVIHRHKISMVRWLSLVITYQPESNHNQNIIKPTTKPKFLTLPKHPTLARCSPRAWDWCWPGLRPSSPVWPAKLGKTGISCGFEIENSIWIPVWLWSMVKPIGQFFKFDNGQFDATWSTLIKFGHQSAFFLLICDICAFFRDKNAIPISASGKTHGKMAWPVPLRSTKRSPSQHPHLCNIANALLALLVQLHLVSVVIEPRQATKSPQRPRYTMSPQNSKHPL